MKYIFIAVNIFLFVSFAKAQRPSFKFDFGSERIAAGYIGITPDSKFSYQKGYGFDSASAPQAVDRGGDALKGDYITSAKPLFFSVKIPEGNYDVKVILGDAKGISATTVRAENRRLMLENIITKNGKFKTETFTVHVKDSVIKDAAGNAIGRVRLKPREISYLHWDNLLTLEFNDSLPKICAVEITPNTTTTTIFLTGNSTVVDQDREPWASWGQMFPRFLVPGKVVVANYAESGETLKSFKGEKRWNKVMSMVKPGDYLFIEFAHNDQKAGSNHLDPFTTYKQTLKEWIAEAKSKSLIPVLVTSMHRRNFDSAGHIINTLSDFPEAMRQTAKEENVFLIDLNAMSKTLFEALGEKESKKAFVHYPAHSYPKQDTALADDTHFNTYGAYELARCIVNDIRKQHLPIEQFIKKETPSFDPAKPLAPKDFYWPPSPFMAAIKPDGN